MKIVFKSEKLTLDEVTSEKINENIFMDHELQVINFVKKWLSDDEYIEFVTSGSTGIPKVIKLTKTQMMHSAESTMHYIDPQNNLKQCILCISPEFIGGAMIIVRSIIKDLDLIVLKPNAIPRISDYSRALVSMVPLQVMKSLESDETIFDSIETLLIGGAELPDRYINLLKKRSVNAYATYGMTETASHIALRHVSSNTSSFQVIADIEIDTDERDCLKINGAVTNHRWLNTNDIVRLIDNHSFEWLGRSDFMINSGGYKVSPEQIENIIKKNISIPVLIVPEKDKVLGQKVVLLVESEKPISISDDILKKIHSFARPKRIQFVDRFIYTANGKIDRLKTAGTYIK